MCPEIRILCESDGDKWQQDECKMISEMSAIHPLYNVAPGGIGGKRPSAGRPMTDLRMLSIGKVGTTFDQPVEYTSEIIVTQCGSCGAVHWEPYHVVVTVTDPLPEPDKDGFLYPVLASAPLPGREAKHSKNCPNKEK